MNTDALIDSLATSASGVTPGFAARRYARALAAGAACTTLVMAVTLGPRHDFATAITLPMFWVKLAFVASLAVLGIVAAYRSGVPARRVRPIVRAIVAIVAGLWVLGAFALARSAPATRAALFFGDTWTSCPWLIAGLSLPVLVAVTWAMKRMAPTRLRHAGAAAGFASGAVAALVYAVHCPELGAPFLGTWYVAGMLVPTTVGALLGERVLRW